MLVRFIFTALFTTFLSLALAGCEQQTTAESVGESIDEAASDAANAVEDACEEAKEGLNTDDQDC